MQTLSVARAAVSLAESLSKLRMYSAAKMPPRTNDDFSSIVELNSSICTMLK